MAAMMESLLTKPPLGAVRAAMTRLTLRHAPLHLMAAEVTTIYWLDAALFDDGLLRHFAMASISPMRGISTRAGRERARRHDRVAHFCKIITGLAPNASTTILTRRPAIFLSLDANGHRAPKRHAPLPHPCVSDMATPSRHSR